MKRQNKLSLKKLNLPTKLSLLYLSINSLAFTTIYYNLPKTAGK